MNHLTACLFLFFTPVYCTAQSPVQLAPPLLKYNSVFFKKAASVQLAFAQPGTKIYYTLNNGLPSLPDNIYSKPIQITKTFTTLKAFAAGEGFLSSEMVAATFIKDGFKIKQVQQTPANIKFPGNGPLTLMDNEGGKTDLNSATWIGYQLDTVQIDMVLEETKNISSVLISFLQDHGSWIYLPERIQLFYFDEHNQSFQLLSEKIISLKELKQEATCEPLLMPASKKIHAQKLRAILYGIKTLPEGFPGSGSHGWIFLDEIKVY